MTKHEIKICPNCETAFECRREDILNCECKTVELTQAQREDLALRFDDCVCVGCLVGVVS